MASRHIGYVWPIHLLLGTFHRWGSSVNLMWFTNFIKYIMKLNDIYDKLCPLNWIRITGNSTYHHSIFQQIPDGALQTTGSHGFGSERCWHRCTFGLYLWCGTSIDNDVTLSTLCEIKVEQIRFAFDFFIKTTHPAFSIRWYWQLRWVTIFKCCGEGMSIRFASWSLSNFFLLPNLYIYKLKCLLMISLLGCDAMQCDTIEV
jgi:hypothetical protein